MRIFSLTIAFLILLMIPNIMETKHKEDLLRKYTEIAIHEDMKVNGLASPGYLLAQIKQEYPIDYDAELAKQAVQLAVNNQLERKGFNNPNVKIHWNL